MTPTSQVFHALNQAFDHFNLILFGGQLPACMITLHRLNRSFGFFINHIYVNEATGERVDEIALCPDTFRVLGRDTRKVMSTLVHEMCHMWQAHFGTPGRTRYHNREWAAIMERVGLIPSATGEPGGPKTGDQMTHYIDEAGPFARAYAELETAGFRFDWHDPTLVEMLKSAGVDPAAPAEPGAGARVKLPRKGGKLAGNRQRYTCPGCGLHAWAKPGARLICGDCEQPME